MKMGNLLKKAASNKKSFAITSITILILISGFIVVISNVTKSSHNIKSIAANKFKESFGGPLYKGNVIDYKKKTYINIKNTIYSINDDKYKTFKKIVSNNTGEFTIYNDKIYFVKSLSSNNNTSDKDNWLCRVNLDGTNEIKILNMSLDWAVSQYEIHNEYIYYKAVNSGNAKLGRVRINGGADETIFNEDMFSANTKLKVSSLRFEDFYINNNKLYCAAHYYNETDSSYDNSIISIDLNGSIIKKLYTTAGHSITSDDEKIEIIGFHDNNILFGLIGNERHDKSGKYALYDGSFNSISIDGNGYKEIIKKITFNSYFIWDNNLWLNRLDDNYICYSIKQQNIITKDNLKQEYSDAVQKRYSTKVDDYYLWLEETDYPQYLNLCKTNDTIADKKILYRKIPTEYNILDDNNILQNTILGVANNIVYFQYTDQGDLAIMDLNKKVAEYLSIDKNGNITERKEFINN